MHQLNATEQKWFSLIQEARSSGLSDKAWCLQNSIPLSTFYYNIRKLRNKVSGLPACRSTVIPEDHEIVKLEVLDDDKLAAIPSYEEKPVVVPGASALAAEPDHPAVIAMDSGYSARIHIGKLTVDIGNSASEQVIRSVISALWQSC